MTTLVIQDCRLPLYSFVQGNPPERTTKYAGGFKPDCNDTIVYVIDWKLTGDKVRLTYQTRNDPYATIYDTDFPLVTITTPVSRPGKSKHWVWNDFGSSWFNRRTGERVTVY